MNCLLDALVGDTLGKTDNHFDESGMKLLSIHLSRHFPNSRYINSYAESNWMLVGDGDHIVMLYSQQIAAMQPLYDVCNAVAPNRYELKNHIVEVGMLPPVSCGGPNLVCHTLKAAKIAGCFIHSFISLNLMLVVII